MLGKVVVIAGAGAAVLLRTRAGQEQVARLRSRLRSRASGGSQTPLVDRRPQALENRPGAAPVLLPDASPAEIARAVLAERPQP